MKRGEGIRGKYKTAGTEDYSPVPVFTTLIVGVGFSVILFTDSRLLSSAMLAYICVVETFLCPSMCCTV